MNRTEQKEIIKDILAVIDDTKSNLKYKELEIQKVLKLAEQLDDSLQDINVSDAFDLEDFTDRLFTEAVGEELTVVYDEIYNFKSELDDHISELSESKAEKLEERYSQLDEVLEKFDQSHQEYESIENALEHIEDAIDMLKDMLK